MSEESKTPDADYVKMSDGPSGGVDALKLDDPNLSQEDKDMRLAIALQQQENAAAYDAHKKRHDAAVAASSNRTARSAVHSRLASVRDKDHGMLRVPTAYTTENAYVNAGEQGFLAPASAPVLPKGASPQEVADHSLATTLQKVEQVRAGTAATTAAIVKEQTDDQSKRSDRSNYHINQKGLRVKP